MSYNPNPGYYPPPGYGYPPPAPAPAPKKKRHWVLITLVVVFVLAGFGSLTGSGDIEDKAKDRPTATTEAATTTSAAPAETPATDAPPATEAPTTAPPTTAAPTTTPPPPPPPAPSAPESKGFVLDSLNIDKDAFDDFSGVARITDTDGGRSAMFTVTVFVGEQVVGTLTGSVSGTTAGQAFTVEFFSSDTYVAFDRYEFQTDIEYTE